MEIQEWRPRPRVSRIWKRVLVGAVLGSVALGGVLILLPVTRKAAVPPAPGPVARAMTAVGAGVPAALPDLAALIGDREAHLREYPRDEESWAVLGAAYVEQGRRTATPAYFPKAEKALRMSLEARAKGNVAALDGLAALAGARNDFREAKKWAEEAVKLAPKRWTTYPLLIAAYTGLGDYKAGSKTLDRLLTLHSGPPVMAQAAVVYRDRGWREDAAAMIADAAAGAATPSVRAACLEQAGQLMWERGDVPESLRYYEEALRTDPDEHPALAGQGRALAALGRTSEALRKYRMAFAARPEPQYALELGELYESLGLGGSARAQYDVLRKRVQQEAAAGVDDELVLGLFEADHGDPAAAVRRLRAEWQRQPGIAVADALGWALHRAGQSAEAVTFAARATDKAHGGGVLSALYAYHLGQIERALERYGPARRHLQAALRINPYFSPLLVPLARKALAALGEPPAEGPPEPTEDPAAGPEPTAGPRRTQPPQQQAHPKPQQAQPLPQPQPQPQQAQPLPQPQQAQPQPGRTQSPATRSPGRAGSR